MAFSSSRLIRRSISNPLGWVAFFSFFLNLSYLAAPIYMMQVYDRVMRSQSVPTLLYLTIIVGAAYATFAMLDGVRGQILASVSDVIEDTLGPRLLHCVTGPLQRGRVRPGAAQLGRDLDIVRQFAAGPAVLAFIDLPWSPIYIVVLLMLNWALGMFTIVICGILLGLSVLGERMARAPMLEAGEAAGRAYQFGEAIARHADCASTMGLGRHLAVRWQHLRSQMLNAQDLASHRAILLSATAKFIRMFAQSAILGLGAYLAIHHKISSGAIFAGSLLLGRSTAPVESVVASWRVTLAARDAFSRMRGALATEPVNHVLLPSPSGEILLEHVTWTPAGVERCALADVTLRVEPGAVLAIVGPNAAGKSTLGKVLSGAIVPDSGVIRLDGAEFASWGPTQLGQAIGYLPQNFSLFPGTIRDNIGRFGEVPDTDILAAAQAAKAHEMILRLPMGYQTQVDEASGSLSGGQRQRVALARALLFDPPVLVLDEPSANLDSDGEAALFGCVSAARERRRTVILITHSAALVRIADYVGTVVEGRLIRVQRSTEFLKRPLAAAGRIRMSNHGTDRRGSKAANRTSVRVGLTTVIVFFVGFGGWAAFAPLDGAVVGSGALTVQDKTKTIQHKEGGVISSLLVQDGDRVALNQVLIRLDDTQVRAVMNVHAAQLAGDRALCARALAEISEKDKIDFSPGLSASDAVAD